jgi:hypothetical protein
MDPKILDVIPSMTPEQKRALINELKGLLYSLSDYTEAGPVEQMPPSSVNPGPLLPTGDAGIQRNGGFMGPPSPMPPQSVNPGPVPPVSPMDQYLNRNAARRGMPAWNK